MWKFKQLVQNWFNLVHQLPNETPREHHYKQYENTSSVNVFLNTENNVKSFIFNFMLLLFYLQSSIIRPRSTAVTPSEESNVCHMTSTREWVSHVNL